MEGSTVLQMMVWIAMDSQLFSPLFAGFILGGYLSLGFTKGNISHVRLFLQFPNILGFTECIGLTDTQIQSSRVLLRPFRVRV